MPKGAYPVIDTLVGARFKVKKCCEVLGVSSAGYYLAKTRPMSPTRIRREWLTGLTREAHADSRGTYGSRRVHAELTKGRGIHVSLALVRILMHNNEIVGIPGPRKVKRIKGTPTSDDLVQRKFERSFLDELWVTDITEHPRTWIPVVVATRPISLRQVEHAIVRRGFPSSALCADDC